MGIWVWVKAFVDPIPSEKLFEKWPALYVFGIEAINPTYTKGVWSFDVGFEGLVHFYPFWGEGGVERDNKTSFFNVRPRLAETRVGREDYRG